MVRQRVHAVAAGYEDLNDHDALRHDEVVQTACERDESLASSSTLCRFERRAERQWAVAIHQVLVEQFIASHRRAPRELVIDFDATDDPVHGHQHGRFFHGYYDRYCLMRRTALRGTALARAQCRTLRLRLLKLGAVVTRNTRTVAVRLSSTCPDQALFRLLVHRLTAG